LFYLNICPKVPCSTRESTHYKEIPAIPNGEGLIPA